MKLVFSLSLLVVKRLVQVLKLSQIMLRSLNINVLFVECSSLSIKLTVEIGILLLSISEDVSLFFSFFSEISNKSIVRFKSCTEVLLSTTLFFINAIEWLFELKKLILQISIVSLLGSEFLSFLSELDYGLFLFTNCRSHIWYFYLFIFKFFLTVYIF